MKNTKKKLRCEGWRRKGGAFTLGPVEWKQCENNSTVMIKFKQREEEEKILPFCNDCWKEGVENGIKILEVNPI